MENETSLKFRLSRDSRNSINAEMTPPSVERNPTTKNTAAKKAAGGKNQLATRVRLQTIRTPTAVRKNNKGRAARRPK
jgi:hypothetical protein